MMIDVEDTWGETVEGKSPIKGKFSNKKINNQLSEISD